MIYTPMGFRFDCLQTGGVQRFKCSPLFFILINKVTVSVAIKSFQSGDSRRPHSGLFTATQRSSYFWKAILAMMVIIIIVCFMMMLMAMSVTMLKMLMAGMNRVSDLIFVTDITHFICGENSVMWRNFRFL